MTAYPIVVRGRAAHEGYPLRAARLLPFAAIVALFFWMPAPGRGEHSQQPGGERGVRAVAGGPENIAALINDRPVTWDDLRPFLAEAAGGAALEEIVLDRMLDRELEAAGLAVTPDDIARERSMLAEAVARDARADPNDAERLLEGIRRSRGLGDARFAAQLARTARLRKLVAASVTVGDEEVRTAYEMRHGRACVTRVIVVESEREATRLWSDLNRSPDNLTGRFSDAAVKFSRDPSAPRGGLLGPVSPLDPTYPAVIRTAIDALKPGTMSPVIGVDKGFAIALVQERIEPDGVTLEEAAPALRDQLTGRRERLAMDELARRLLASARVGVMDPHLRWSWEAREAAR